jgi:hypothetical protein
MKRESENGGAFRIFGGAKCYCTTCEVGGNKAGGIFVFGSFWVKESKVVDNSGIFGGIYFIEEFILPMIYCKFEGNRGLLEDFCVDIENRVIIESENCIFKDCDSLSICFEVIPKSVRFACNYLKCYGIPTFSKMKVGLIVMNCLCFEGFKLNFEDDILFSLIGIGETEDNGSSCKKEGDEDEEIEKNTIGFDEMKIENVIHENKCIRLCECGDARMGGRYCNCNIDWR